MIDALIATSLDDILVSVKETADKIKPYVDAMEQQIIAGKNNEEGII